MRSPIDLTVSRGQLRDATLGGTMPESVDFDDLERLLLAFEELAATGCATAGRRSVHRGRKHVWACLRTTGAHQPDL